MLIHGGKFKCSEKESKIVFRNLVYKDIKTYLKNI